MVIGLVFTTDDFVVLEAFLHVSTFYGATQSRPASVIASVPDLVLAPSHFGCASFNMVSELDSRSSLILPVP